MITKKLNVGDYIFQATGSLARIIKINKTTYSYVVITNTYESGNVAFDGIKKMDYWGQHEEWFECDNVQAKALERAFRSWKIDEENKRKIEEVNEIIGKAKYFLKEIEEIKEIEVEENE